VITLAGTESRRASMRKEAAFAEASAAIDVEPERAAVALELGVVAL